MDVFNHQVSALGEGPLFWKGQFYWVDIVEGKVFRAAESCAKAEVIYDRPELPITSIVVGADDQLYVTTTRGFACLKISQEPEALGTLRLASHGMRFNDGKVGPDGRYWAGTMDTTEVGGTGSLFRLGKNAATELLLGGVTVSNGLCWSADAKKFYYVDSPLQKIWEFQMDDDGRLVERRGIFEIGEDQVFPDGMTIDQEGQLWLALWNGHGVLRIDPANGTVTERLEVPCKKVTSCCFGGADMSQLLITTSSLDMSDQDWKDLPDSGKVFVAKTSTRGLDLNLYEP